MNVCACAAPMKQRSPGKGVQQTSLEWRVCVLKYSFGSNGDGVMVLFLGWIYLIVVVVVAIAVITNVVCCLCFLFFLCYQSHARISQFLHIAVNTHGPTLNPEFPLKNSRGALALLNFLQWTSTPPGQHNQSISWFDFLIIWWCTLEILEISCMWTSTFYPDHTNPVITYSSKLLPVYWYPRLIWEGKIVCR